MMSVVMLSLMSLVRSIFMRKFSLMPIAVISTSLWIAMFPVMLVLCLRCKVPFSMLPICLRLMQSILIQLIPSSVVLWLLTLMCAAVSAILSPSFWQVPVMMIF